MLAAASRHASVVLEGQGADELLAGYDSRYLAMYRRDERAAITARDFIPRLYRLAMTGHWLRKSRRAIRSLTRVRRQSSVYSSAEILSRTLTVADAPADANLNFPDRLTTALAYDHSRDVLPNLLNYGDRIAMAHGVELRLPFLDHRLVELVFSLPFDAKMRGGVSKYILRKSVGVDLPPEIWHGAVKLASRRRTRTGSTDIMRVPSDRRWSRRPPSIGRYSMPTHFAALWITTIRLVPELRQFFGPIL